MGYGSYAQVHHPASILEIYPVVPAEYYEPVLEYIPNHNNPYITEVNVIIGWLKFAEGTSVYASYNGGPLSAKGLEIHNNHDQIGIGQWIVSYHGDGVYNILLSFVYEDNSTIIFRSVGLNEYNIKWFLTRIVMNDGYVTFGNV